MCLISLITDFFDLCLVIDVSQSTAGHPELFGQAILNNNEKELLNLAFELELGS